MTENKSLLIIGNSNVGKSSITRLILTKSKQYKGKSGKKPGSTLLIRPVEDPNLPYSIVDLPGFGYMKKSSRRREDHIKDQIVMHIEHKHEQYFAGLVVINVLRIEDEIQKYFVNNRETIPLSFELINFLREFHIPILIIFNKIDKISNYDMKKTISNFVFTAENYNLIMTHFDDYNAEEEVLIPYLEFSALKKTNLGKLKLFIHQKFIA